MIAKNVIFVLLIFLSSYLGSIFILLPITPLFFLKHGIWRRWVDKIVGFWELFPVGLLEFFIGIEFKVFGERIRCEDKAVIIMNHRTRLDWMFFWNALFKIDPWLVTTEKISLKSDLKNIPGAGWAMECNSFMFLYRYWTTDEKIMSDLCTYYGRANTPYQILIFPEGTDYCQKTADRSETFATENNLPKLHFLLQPRTTGFVHLVNELKKNNAIDYIYDVTVAYPNTIVQTETDFTLSGQCPESAHFSIKRYNLVDDVPSEDDDQLTEWCRKLWSEKDKMLSEFYEPSQPEQRQFSTTLIEEESRTWSSAVLFIALLFWIVSVCIWFYCTIMYFYVKLYVIFGTCVFIGVQKCFGGVEKLALNRWPVVKKESEQ